MCVCFTDGSRAHKEEPAEIKTKASLSTHSDHHIGGHHLKTFLLLAEPPAKTKFVPNDHHDHHQQQLSTMELATSPPSPDAALSCVYFFIFLLKRLLCSVYCYIVGACCATGTDWPRPVAVCCHGYRRMTWTRGGRGNVTGTFCSWVWRKLGTQLPQPSGFRRPLCCCVSTLRPLPLICVCMCVFFSIHVGTKVVDLQSEVILAWSRLLQQTGLRLGFGF